MSAPASATSPAAPPRLRLAYLDGIRGCAALYVALTHVNGLVMNYAAGPGAGIGPGLTKVLRFANFGLFTWGHYAVDIFIVLSGYSLMLPVVRGARHELPGGLAEYVKRRARRILPPYYAALALSVALLLWPAMSSPANPWRGDMLPLGAGAVASHLLLVHNLRDAWIFKINSPMWSVALEWQIYFLFPAVLLPVWRRAGGVAAALVGTALGLAPHYLLSGRWELSCPWYLGLFAMGMLAASIGFRERASRWNERSDASTTRGNNLRPHPAPWGWSAAVLALLVAGLSIAQRGSWQNVRWLRPLQFSTWGSVWPTDVLTGLAVLCFLVYATEQMRGGACGKSALPVRLLEARGAQWLGRFSYSLYLIHAPALAVFGILLRRQGCMAQGFV